MGEWGHDLAARRAHLVDALSGGPGVTVAPAPGAAFVLVHRAGGSALRIALRSRGFLLRRGDDYPGLGPDWFRVAVPSTVAADRFAAALRDEVSAAGR